MSAEGPARCELCGEPMPPGEEMFKYHGNSGPCPTKPPKEATGPAREVEIRRQLVEDTLRDRRNLMDARLCPECGGWGVTTYANTSTWRRSVGGNAMRADVCDKCWGSGDANRPWPSHRDLAAERTARQQAVEKAQAYADVTRDYLEQRALKAEAKLQWAEQMIARLTEGGGALPNGC